MLGRDRRGWCCLQGESSATTNTQRTAYCKFTRTLSHNQRRRGSQTGVSFIRKVFLKGRGWSLTLILSRAVPAGRVDAQGCGAHLGVEPKFPTTSAQQLPCESWAAPSPLGQLGDKDGGPAPARRKWPGFLFVCKSQSSTMEP